MILLYHTGAWECLQILLYPQDNLSQSSVMPPLAGPSGHHPLGMWQSPSRPPAVVVDLA